MSKALMHALLVDVVADAANVRHEATSETHDTTALKMRVASLEDSLDKILEVLLEMVTAKK